MEPGRLSPPDERCARDRLAHNVRRARDTRQLSIADLAQQTGLPRGFLEAVENGTVDPSAIELAAVEALAKALGVQESELFSRES